VNNGDAVIDPAAGLVVTTIDISRSPTLIALDSRNGLLYATPEAGNDAVVLQWHYRSRDEPLIAFSNAHIYDRMLTTA
jgi:hypothetical protein